MDRDPAVAGRFYAGEPDRLALEVDRFLAGGAEPVRAFGVVAPHAGYVYSGAVAGAVYGRVVVPERVVVLGPNHTGLGGKVALWADGRWETPLGRVPVDAEMAEALLASTLVERGREAHRYEHSLEVQVPFLQRRQRRLSIAPLCLGPLSLAECEALGKHDQASRTLVTPCTARLTPARFRAPHGSLLMATNVRKRASHYKVGSRS